MSEIRESIKLENDNLRIRSDEEIFRKIAERFGMSRLDAALDLSLVSDFGDTRPRDFKIKTFEKSGKIIADISPDNLKKLLDVLKEKYQKNLLNLTNEDLEETTRYSGLLKNFHYFDMYEFGDIRELFSHLLDFGSMERAKEGSRFHNNSGEFMWRFIDFKYFPKDSRLNNFARDFIKSLLPAGKTVERNKQSALEYVQKFVKEGIFSEEGDGDIIEMVTSQ